MNEFDHRVVLIAHDASIIDAVVSTARPLGHPIKHFDAVTNWFAEVNGSLETSLDDSPVLFSGLIVLEQSADGANDWSEVKQVCTQRCGLPVVVISPRLSVSETVSIMRAGAFTVLEHPTTEEALSEAITSAMRKSHQLASNVVLAKTVGYRLTELKEGEHAVLKLLIQGNANKEIAHALEIGLRTVELRRSRIMKKMQASSLAELVRFVCTAQSISGPIWD